MMLGGGLAPTLGWLVEASPGAGMSLTFIIAGAVGILVSLLGYTFRVVRNVEDIIPDHKQEASLETETWICAHKG